MADFLNMLVDIRGAHPDNAIPSDGMYWEIAMKPIDGNPGMYGDFVVKYDSVVGKLESTRRLIENATSNFSGANSKLLLHTEDKGNPHNVTKAQVGLDNVDNTSDASKPISDLTAAALNNKFDNDAASVLTQEIHSISDTLDYHINGTSNNGAFGGVNNNSNPHNITATTVGLSNVDNTSDLDKPISNAVANALSSKLSSVSKSDIGLGSVDNTSDTDKPVSLAQSQAISLAVRDKASVQSLNSHINDVGNPHNVTKMQIGLSDVDNTSDVDKPVSTATALAISKKLDSAHGSNTSNPHNVTKEQVGLSNVNNTSDANKPISIATSAALDARPLISSVVLKTDIEDSLTSASSIKVLSAAQGYQLQEQIHALTGDVTVIAGSITEDAATLSTSRKIELVGDATGAVYFDGSKDVQIDVTIPAAPDVTFADILNTPTTLAGYGITDSITPAEVDSRIAVSAFGIKYSVADIATRDSIPTPKTGEQVVVQSERFVYRYSGSSWVFFYELDGTHNHDSRYYTKTESDVASSNILANQGKVGPSLLLVDETSLADKSVVSYNATTNKLEYVAPTVQTSEILDSSTAVDKTWSASKISTELAAKMDDVTLAPVATTGSYNDLADLPAAASGGGTFGPHEYVINDAAAEQMEVDIAAGNTNNIDALFPVALPSAYTGADGMTMSFFTFTYIIDAVVSSLPSNSSEKFGPNSYTITSSSPADGQVVTWDAGNSMFVYSDAATGSVVINDNGTSTAEAWSASKINTKVNTLQQNIDNISSGGASIDDAATNTTETWSSEKINSEISNINAKTFYDDSTGILYMTTDGTTPGP